MIIYQNNDVTITVEAVDSIEAKVNINDKNLIWISREQETEFIKELNEILDKFRI